MDFLWFIGFIVILPMTIGGGVALFDHLKTPPTKEEVYLKCVEAKANNCSQILNCDNPPPAKDR